jgi:hypothetical protein
MFCVESEADMRCLAAPKADPTFSDMFMNDVDEEMDVLKKCFIKYLGLRKKTFSVETSVFY